MLKKINTDKLPLKYYLQFYPSLDNYPLNEDILFEILSNEDIYSDALINYKIVKYLISAKIQKERFLEFIDWALDKKFVESTDDKSIFRIIKNPWS